MILALKRFCRVESSLHGGIVSFDMSQNAVFSMVNAGEMQNFVLTVDDFCR